LEELPDLEIKEIYMTNEPEKLNLHSMDLTEEKKQELLHLFPEIRTEGGQIDFDRLKLALGETVDVGKERYGMNWPGKAECFRTVQAPSAGTLLPCPEESINFDTTENLILEGDNLEVLKLLQKAYLGKVKMIFIDPPYNTGNDFIYPDNYTESLQTYLEYTGQVDSEGRKFGTNSDTDGRFHSRWMNMMYPRLYLARNLMQDDGVIFISIDDSEVANLRKLCDEIFGEENFIADIIWEKRFTRNNDAKLISSVFDHIIEYRKSDELNHLREPRNEKTDSIYSNPDNDPRGPWTSVSYVSQRTKDERPNLSYPLVNPITGNKVVHTTNAWKYSYDQYSFHLSDGRLYWGQEGNNQFPRLKRFLSELNDGIVPINLWKYKETGTIDDGTKILDNLIGKDVFTYPKPPSLVVRMLNMVVPTSEKQIILDFFAGSGTTAHAVLDLNNKDGGNRKFVLVQLPESCERDTEAAKAGYLSISDITKERVRRVIKKLNNADAGQLQLGAPQDRGFRVFKLAQSNFKPWNAQLRQDAAALEQQLELHIEHIREERRPDDILYEILLKSGFPLTLHVETLILEGKQVYSVAGGALLICLEPKLTMEVIRAMAAQKPERVVCLDAGFAGNDQLKANAVQIFKTQGIPSFKTV
jgi:adenine-specific DNA-methyltransferase